MRCRLSFRVAFIRAPQVLSHYGSDRLMADAEVSGERTETPGPRERLDCKLLLYC
jgi:hypothetical protein